MHTVLVLGGYGFFGERIASALARNPEVRLLIGGRNESKSKDLARLLGLTDDRGVQLDATSHDLAARLRALGVNTVIHTAGPFQGQDYKVARDAIDAGSNYIDLADGRAFVAGIGALDSSAREHGVAIISGASSVPALSSAVVDRYAPAFQRLDAIRIGIGSGARAPGLATVRGVFGYCGKHIRRLEDGEWVDTFGWLDLKRHRFPDPVGPRWLGSCDVPDLELFPKRYRSVHTVTFHGGFASDMGHLFVWGMAGLVKAGIIGRMAPFARPLNQLSRWLEPVVSDKGAMFVHLEGLDRDNRPMTKRWNLVACRNHGPYIPCGAAIALAERFARGTGVAIGAQACMGLLTVEEYLAPLAALDIREIADPS